MIGIGIDAVDIDRFRTTLARSASIAERLFTPGELAYARQANDPTERLAARFAAKEAVMKVLGVGLGAFGFHDVEVTRHDSGRPYLVLRGAALELAEQAGVVQWHISLTHTDLQAQAFVLAE
ncbi:MAG: holo-[acyl-carrier protein] synthase [Candidatus Poriferisodalaceae bacterium]|jgi:holo-[acyl-carrier protein] synthase